MVLRMWLRSATETVLCSPASCRGSVAEARKRRGRAPLSRSNRALLARGTQPVSKATSKYVSMKFRCKFVHVYVKRTLHYTKQLNPGLIVYCLIVYSVLRRCE